MRQRASSDVSSVGPTPSPPPPPMMSNADPNPDPDHGDANQLNLNRSNRSNRDRDRSAMYRKNPLRKTALQERLVKDIVVLELHEDGGREYQTMTLRGLYDYVIRAITKKTKLGGVGVGNEKDMNNTSMTSIMGNQSLSQLRAGRKRQASYGSINDLNSPKGNTFTHTSYTSDGITCNVDQDGGTKNDNINAENPLCTIPELQSQSQSPEAKVPPSTSSLPSPSSSPPFLPPLEKHPPQEQFSPNSPTPLFRQKDQSVRSILSAENEHHHHPQHQQQQHQQHHHHNSAGKGHTLEEGPHTNASTNTSTSANANTPTLTNTNINTNTNSHPNTNANITIRERLGGYLHPRDMRRLVMPFGASNEPELMVRRHVMLLNFDPLRAIVLRDRLLVLVPDGADSILMNLERRVRGGIDEMEKQVFGESTVMGSGSGSGSGSGLRSATGSASVLGLESGISNGKNDSDVDGSDDGLSFDAMDENEKDIVSDNDEDDISIDDNDDEDTNDEVYVSNHQNNDRWSTRAESSRSTTTYNTNYEFQEFEDGNWIEMAFELQSVDAVLSSVCKMLSDESLQLRRRIFAVMEEMRGDADSGEVNVGTMNMPGDHVQEQLRQLKDKVRELEGRVQGFVRAMNQILDDEEDMALMNLSRLISHPERFIQPVAQDVLNEESDEPELILEVYLQQAFSEANALNLIVGNIVNTEELVSLQMDIVRNRLLYVNTVVSVISLSVAMASLVGSMFGMNLTNHMENDETAFVEVVVGTLVGTAVILVLILVLIAKSGVMPVNPRKVLYSRRRIDSMR